MRIRSVSTGAIDEVAMWARLGDGLRESSGIWIGPHRPHV
jgi:hypothetical protein